MSVVPENPTRLPMRRRRHARLFVSCAVLAVAILPFAQAAVRARNDGTVEIRTTTFEGRTPPIAVAKAGRYAVHVINDEPRAVRLRFSDGTIMAVGKGRRSEATLTIPPQGLAFAAADSSGADSTIAGVIAVVSGRVPVTSGNAIANTRPTETPPPTVFDPIAPKRLSGSMHSLDIRVEEKPMTVADGKVQRVWTFNGTVPGPVIRIRVGDTVDVHFTNLKSNTTPHSLDFHASEVAWNDQMVTINPGEERDFVWAPHYAGVYMYHCISGPPVMHVASGMFGMMIVEPREGLPKVDREFALVQNEWYLGPPGETISFAKASAPAAAPDFMTFNGVADQYVNSPLKVKRGERVRLFVHNAGPNLESSFHVVGMVFHTVIKEGVGLRKGNVGGYGSQAVDLAPAQGAIIEFDAPEDGLYPFVTHTFNFHDRGAHGVIQVGDGVPKNKLVVASNHAPLRAGEPH